jgi:maltose O-acetyltransferase
MTIGMGAYIESFVRFRYPDLRKVLFGERSYLNEHCYLDNTEHITIGGNVCIAPFVRILTATHEIGPDGRRAGKFVKAPVVIEDGCWICAGSTILPGTTIRSGTIIAAGSVVTEGEYSSNRMYAGIPSIPKGRLVQKEIDKHISIPFWV